MKIGIRAGLLSLMMLLAGLSVWGAVGTVMRTEDVVPAEIYARYHAKSARAQYLVREENGYVAVYRSGQNRAEQTTKIETALLRRADRAMLDRGIPAESMGEVLQLLADLGS